MPTAPDSNRLPRRSRTRFCWAVSCCRSISRRSRGARRSRRTRAATDASPPFRDWVSCRSPGATSSISVICCRCSGGCGRWPPARGPSAPSRTGVSSLRRSHGSRFMAEHRSWSITGRRSRPRQANRRVGALARTSRRRHADAGDAGAGFERSLVSRGGRAPPPPKQAATRPPLPQSSCTASQDRAKSAA